MEYIILPDGSIFVIRNEKDRQEAIELALEERRDLSSDGE